MAFSNATICSEVLTTTFCRNFASEKLNASKRRLSKYQCRQYNETRLCTNACGDFNARDNAEIAMNTLNYICVDHFDGLSRTFHSFQVVLCSIYHQSTVLSRHQQNRVGFRVQIQVWRWNLRHWAGKSLRKSISPSQLHSATYSSQDRFYSQHYSNLLRLITGFHVGRIRHSSRLRCFDEHHGQFVQVITSLSYLR